MLTLILLLIAQPNDLAIAKLLWQDYQRYGLPNPPTNSQLAWLTETRNGSSSDKEPPTVSLLLVAKPHAKMERSVCWVGCEVMPDYHLRGNTLELVDPGESAIEGTQPLGAHYQDWPRYPTNTDIALAAQCYGRGWQQLASKIVARHRASTMSLGTQSPKLSNPRFVLAQVAWNHWCNMFSTEKGDRAFIVKHLKTLHASGLGMDTPLHRNFIQDMEATLRPTKSSDPATQTVEEVLNQLMELDNKRNHSWINGRFSEQSKVSDRRFDQLYVNGLNTIPLLLKHVDDYRLTRCLASEDGYTWNIRIADVVAVYLHQWIGEELRYDFLQKEGRGVRVDRRQVDWWLAQHQKQTERDTLLSLIIHPFGDKDRRRASLGVLIALATRHPDDFFRLWNKVAGQEAMDPELYIQAMKMCRCSQDERDRLLLTVMGSESKAWRCHAAIALAGNEKAEQIVKEWLKEMPDVFGKISHDHDSRQILRAAMSYKSDTMLSALVDLGKRLQPGSRVFLLQMLFLESENQEDMLAVYRPFLTDTSEVSLKLDSQNGEELSQGLPYWIRVEKLSVNQYVALHLASHWNLYRREPDANWTTQEWQALIDAVTKELATRQTKARSKR